MKHMTDEDLEAKKRMDLIKQDLKDKEDKLEEMEALSQTLIIKQRLSNDELVDAHKELTSLLVSKEWASLITKPFIVTAKINGEKQDASLSEKKLGVQAGIL